MKKKFLIIILIIALIIGSYFVININKKNNFVVNNLINENENTSWKITQFGSNNDNQMMCFTIEGNKDGLIIVDGGYENSDYNFSNLQSVIQKHNNKVDAWIITHLDSDHAGVLVNVLKNHNDIDIKKIYTTNYPDFELAKEKAPWEGEWEQYLYFSSLDMENIELLSEGDRIDNLIGLKMNVLWAYSDWVGENSTNLLNNGSLVFKLSGQKQSILFCGDTQSIEICNKIIENHSKELDSDYLQVGHHGNNWFSEDFYDLVSPEVAFICAPDSIKNNVNNISWYTVDKIVEMLESKGVKILSDSTSPNIVTIK